MSKAFVIGVEPRWNPSLLQRISVESGWNASTARPDAAEPAPESSPEEKSPETEGPSPSLPASPPVRIAAPDTLAYERAALRSAVVAAIGLLAVIGGIVVLSPHVKFPTTVTAMGKIVAPTREMAVGSPEGGLVARVFVHPYDLVKEGDPLVELDRAAPEADMNRLAYAEASARADVIRLEAELKGSIPDVSGLPAEIAQAARATWEARTKKHADQVAAKEAEIQALRGLQDSYVKSLAAKEEVLNRLQEGVADGGVARNRVDGQRSEVAEYRGRVSKGVADIGNVTAQIAALRSTDIESAYKDLNEARLKQRDAEQQLHKAQAQERHMTLRAPATGQIKTLTAMGPGMAVKPGETVVEIVEASDIHRIDALLPAEDGANVRVGDLVRVSLDKDDGTHDGFDGHILAIAPGSVADNKSGQLKMAIEVSVEAEAFPSRVNGVAVPIKDGVPVRVEGELARRSFFTIVLGRLFGMHDNLSRGS